MKVLARIILTIMFVGFLVGGILTEDGFWKFCAYLILLAMFMLFILILLTIGFLKEDAK